MGEQHLNRRNLHSLSTGGLVVDEHANYSVRALEFHCIRIAHERFSCLIVCMGASRTTSPSGPQRGAEAEFARASRAFRCGVRTNSTGRVAWRRLVLVTLSSHTSDSALERVEHAKWGQMGPPVELFPAHEACHCSVKCDDCRRYC